MSAMYRINLASPPLTEAILAAKLTRLKTRSRESLVVTAAMGFALACAIWFGLTAPAQDTTALAGVISVVLALMLFCALHVLWRTHLTLTSLRPATASQLSLVVSARDLPVVTRYLEAVQAQGRSINRAESDALAKYSAGAGGEP